MRRRLSVLAALFVTTAPVRGGWVAFTIPDSAFFAEGLDVDTARGTVYVASIRKRTVVALRGTTVRDLHVHADRRIGAVFGVRVSADGRTLWCTTAPHENTETPTPHAVPALVEVDAASGAIRRVVPLPAPPGGTSRLPGDLALAPDGTVLISDSNAPALLLYAPRTGRWTIISDPRWRSPQGVALTPRGDVALLADYAHGLFRIDLHTQHVTRVRVDAPISVLGLDGLAWGLGRVIGVQNGVTPARIVALTLTPDATAITALEVLDQQPDLAPEPTIGAMLGEDFVYVANSQWGAYAAGRRTTQPLGPTRIICVRVAQSARQGSRNTASAPPPGASCKSSAAAAP